MQTNALSHLHGSYHSGKPIFARYTHGIRALHVIRLRRYSLRVIRSLRSRNN
jgi:hypothetical protein